MKGAGTITLTCTECDHINYTYRRARVHFWLFDLTMDFKVCHKCSKMIRTQQRWNIKFN